MIFVCNGGRIYVSINRKQVTIVGTRFRKSIKLGKHVRINLSKSGIGYSVGTKGYRVTKMANGRTRTTMSIPGTGISHVSETSSRSKSADSHTYDPAPSASAPVRGAPSTVAARFVVGMLVFAASIGVCILVFMAVTFFSVFGDSDSPDDPVTTSAAPVTTPVYSAPTVLTMDPSSPIIIPVGEISYFTVFWDNSPDPSVLKIVVDADAPVQLELIRRHDDRADYKVWSDTAGVYKIRAEYGDCASDWLIVDTSGTSITEDPLADLPIVYLNTYILNTDTKIIHSYYCSFTPDASSPHRKTTTDYYGSLDIGYTPCKRCNP